MKEECRREYHSKVMMLTEGRRVDQRLEVSGWKIKESSTDTQAELTRWDIQLDDIREIESGLLVPWSLHLLVVTVAVSVGCDGRCICWW